LNNKDKEIVEKYTGISMPQDDEPSPLTDPAQGEHGSYSKIEAKGTAVTLDLRKKTGDRETFPYSYLIRMRFDKSGIITLKFSDTKVTITGRNLTGLYDGLKDYKVPSIQEGDDRYDEASEDETFISCIEIEQPI